jgi:type I restriction enzyme S subunit
LDEKTGKIDELIVEKTKQVEDLRSFRTSVITEAVTHGLNPNVPLRQSGIDWLGEIPEHWILSRAKYYIDIKSGDAISKDKINDSDDYPVYGGGELIGYTDAFNVEKHTIIIGRVGARCGCITLANTKSWATDNALILNTSINVPYLTHLLEAANLNRLNESNAQPLITATKIKDLFIPVPPISEQQEIADYLDEKTAKIDKLISELNTQLAELAEYKQAVISEAVTGKVDVRDYKSSL